MAAEPGKIYWTGKIYVVRQRLIEDRSEQEGSGRTWLEIPVETNSRDSVRALKAKILEDDNMSDLRVGSRLIALASGTNPRLGAEGVFTHGQTLDSDVLWRIADLVREQLDFSLGISSMWGGQICMAAEWATLAEHGHTMSGASYAVIPVLDRLRRDVWGPYLESEDGTYQPENNGGSSENDDSDDESDESDSDGSGSDDSHNQADQSQKFSARMSERCKRPNPNGPLPSEEEQLMRLIQQESLQTEAEAQQQRHREKRQRKLEREIRRLSF